MAIEPVKIAENIMADFRRYLLTALKISPKHPTLKHQFEDALKDPDRLFRGPYLQGLSPYIFESSIQELVDEDHLPKKILDIPFLDKPSSPLYWHQAEAIRRVRAGHNVAISSGTGSGKTLAFLIPIISEILENPAPGIHAMLLYPMNALVNDQLKLLRSLLREKPEIRFGRYVNVEITPYSEEDGRQLYPSAPENEVVSRNSFRENPPQILITNYAMLEYLLLRAEDSPLFHGPWKYIVLDEAHTYSGAKGSEMALLLRRLRSRVKSNYDDKIQYIATSATLGTSDAKARKEVIDFASDLFDAEFTEDDIISARREHSPIPNTVISHISESIYRNPILLEACEEKRWSDDLAAQLKESGFPQRLIDEAEKLAEACPERSRRDDYEAALYHVFSNDRRAHVLRETVENSPAIYTAAEQIFGSKDSDAMQSLVGLVRICSLARSPQRDSRLVPCRYHFLVRGLDGAYVAFDHKDDSGNVSPTLLLDPARTTKNGKFQTLQLFVCRKCGQPYFFGYEFREGAESKITAFGSPDEGRGTPIWLVWNQKRPQAESIDEDDVDDEVKQLRSNFQRVTYCPQSGVLKRDCTLCGDGSNEITMWIVAETDTISKCFACGGSSSVTPIKASADAAQSVIAESFYRCLPESQDRKALYYPGKGRKLLSFSDSRQGAAYFAPYIENKHTDQKLRWLIYHAIQTASRNDRVLDLTNASRGKNNRQNERFISAGSPNPKDYRPISGDTLIDFMIRIASDEQLFPFDQEEADIRKSCAIALIKEFCLPFSRRQSLEALGLVAVTVELGPFYQPPDQLAKEYGLTEEEIYDLIQCLLASLRLQKIISLPMPLAPQNEEFWPFNRWDVAVTKGNDEGYGYQMHGFLPAVNVTRQRRSAYLKRVLTAAVKRLGKNHVVGQIANLSPNDQTVLDILVVGQIANLSPNDQTVLDILFELWNSLTDVDGPVAPLERKDLYGKTGYLIKWKNLKFSIKDDWAWCQSCNQLTSTNVLGICPSFACDGNLQKISLSKVFADHHYRSLYLSEKYIPLVAKEHTAQLRPKLATEYQKAFSDGHSRDHGQINILSCSTTFELGVDLGDLEAVFLRNIPPTPANYQQRAGRAGRGAGKAAFVITFALPRSHDEHYFSEPEEMICGTIRPPKISLTNEIIIKRHLNAILLSDFIRNSPASSNNADSQIRKIGEFFKRAYDDFVRRLDVLIQKLTPELQHLIPKSFPSTYLQQLPDTVRKDFGEAYDYYMAEIEMYDESKKETIKRRNEMEKTGKYTKQIAGYIYYLQRRIDELHRTNWIRFFSDRNVLPRYAFPIYNVSLETSDLDLRLGRDLKIALSEYAPGASIVAKGKLWESIGIRRPPKRALINEYYAYCPHCWHVERNLDRRKLFEDGLCPVCGHDGRSPVRYRNSYIIPKYGFTTDTRNQGKKIVFDRPVRIRSSRVFFLPQQEETAPVLSLGEPPGTALTVRTNDNADFFVFNNNKGKGFRICKSCGRLVTKDEKEHKTPRGYDCKGRTEQIHLAHEFKSTASRLLFYNTGYDYSEHRFWLSLMYALLEGISDGLGIERRDLDGVIRPIMIDGITMQEVVLFDNVPGGAGHVRRLEDPDELRIVLETAYKKTADCTCSEDASCYKCLRSYGNQFCHDILERGLAAEYLEEYFR